jgi:4-amino-4-deoxy-L-arabinose transferase-like glycosyltransferase
LNAFIGDEAIRSLVAFEMMESQNYLVPTMNGNFYFAKPPLYNWILIGFYKLFGRFDEWTTRIPTVIFSIVFSFVIWVFNKNRFQNNKFAIVLAFMFLTCGRILFYDSFLGLIDIFFSLVTYVMIMLAYYFADKSKFNLMYVSLYILSVIGFMLKGLPIFHFLVFTIIIIHYLFGNWKAVYSKFHIITFVSAVLVITLYFIGYNQYIDAQKTISPLVDQAARRTIFKYNFSDSINHFVTYPIENILHFFPWSLLGILVFQKNIITLIKKNLYIWYITLTFIFNYIVYWISPEVYPRYILMLIPLIFTVWIYLYEFEIGIDNVTMKMVAFIFKAILVMTPIYFITELNNPWLKYVDLGKEIVIVLIVLLVFVTIAYFWDRKNRTIIFVIFLLLIRIGLNAIVLPIRTNTSDKEVFKREAIRIAEKYQDIKVYDKSSLYWLTSVYLSQKTGEIINKESDLTRAKYFIIDSTYMNSFVKIDSFYDAAHCGTRWIIEGHKK